jgi:hypothetical protein
MPHHPKRRLRVIARDPAMTVLGRILTEVIEIPNEPLQPGPQGHRVQVVDYNTTTRRLYRPLSTSDYANGHDPFLEASDDRLLGTPTFHAQNVYAIVMRTLGLFEDALGRRATWRFGKHQIALLPHAFADTNAFYSPAEQALLFGYFPGR